jgi:hypothetical protein
MAITLVTQPTFPNFTYTNLVYAVSSSVNSQPQFQYVMDVTQGGVLLSRTKQYPNPNGVGIFDPSRILNDYLTYEESWTVNNETTPTSQVQDFQIRFGEEYGTSVSSSVILYDGNGNPGSPAVQGTTSTVTPGVVDPNNGISFNWQSQSMALTNMPYTDQELSYNDYHTMTFYNSGNLVTASVDYNPGPTIEYDISSSANGFSIVPISTKNIGAGANWTTVTVTAGSDTWVFNKAEECNYDRIRFAFINKYGQWDYYGFNLPIRKTTTVNRQQIEKPFVNYSSVSGTYDVNRRGKDYYNTQYNDSISVTTPYINQETAIWLSELLESPSVFLQEGSSFIPIIITNGSYTHYTNLRGQKTFQYDIQYQYSNNRVGR